MSLDGSNSMTVARSGILLCLVVLAACGSKEATGFSTPEELKEAYRISYEVGDLEAILAMVY